MMTNDCLPTYGFEQRMMEVPFFLIIISVHCGWRFSFGKRFQGKHARG